jgi:hypothetical protein
VIYEPMSLGIGEPLSSLNTTDADLQAMRGARLRSWASAAVLGAIAPIAAILVSAVGSTRSDPYPYNQNPSPEDYSLLSGGWSAFGITAILSVVLTAIRVILANDYYGVAIHYGVSHRQR